MRSVIVALIGLSLLGAIFAAIYYSPENVVLRESGVPAFNMAPGEARIDFLEPSIPGGPILVELTVVSGRVDVYLMDQEWASSLTREGSLDISKPFSYHAQWSQIGVNDTYSFTILADGKTRYGMLIDNADNYYEGDTVPDEDPVNGTASIRIQTRYLAEEQRSLMLGYMAATPSVLLVGYAFAKKWQRHRDAQKAAGAPAAGNKGQP